MSIRRSRRRVRGLAGACAATLLASVLTACGAGASDGPAETVTIGYQPGLGYSTLLLMKEQGVLEEALPDTEITWRELDSGGALRDAVIAGDVQIAAMGASPFLVGVDAGVGWKTVAAMNQMNLQLMVKDPAIKTLKDLPKDAKIAMPAPDSIQSLPLRKAAGEQLGDPRALDQAIVGMGHPDGLQALVSGQITGHLTAPPFVAQEAAAGAHPILKSYDLFGRTTFNAIYAKPDFLDANPEFTEAFYAALKESNTLLNDDPDKAAELLSAESEGELSADEVKTQITDPDVTWSLTPTGFDEFAEFMASVEMIKKAPAAEDVYVDNEFSADVG
ncbi:NitT/TauT family transport system substrate-binding protein [Nocardioides luteus]|uniref:Nitrate ABC transporter substrate-binding protein n=1 Tax=Nocardioides luteus TaxID=1844 RepID=A0ABQ5SS73_9ACTN|nr:ABC transporter substrate-binding protein [Nocardioides luteus]MDR7310105.1 NitT/TauT family transport system substrate-binding protein [Nocardioides luteus]GGR64752.1 nitrate ABC transporter substrate-binding protein [Nocardioides luteus]GLJ66987.1 nitrate ABC transporter substrate-binding protein [Nocardioides luteus]